MGDILGGESIRPVTKQVLEKRKRQVSRDDDSLIFVPQRSMFLCLVCLLKLLR